mmetsp:Transcript_38817/g.112203  ORF Transcript_38817/g.112203 Transcript_38817/m.112203 type:complete len:82 (+) Transcript_38817:943-1188(+)
MDFPFFERGFELVVEPVSPLALSQNLLLCRINFLLKIGDLLSRVPLAPGQALDLGRQFLSLTCESIDMPRQLTALLGRLGL